MRKQTEIPKPKVLPGSMAIVVADGIYWKPISSVRASFDLDGNAKYQYEWMGAGSYPIHEDCIFATKEDLLKFIQDKL